MNRILVGTASSTDKSLIASGRCYPPKCNPPEDRLRYYESQFPLVEVDSSYCAMPAPQVAQLWAERTPPGFKFNVKALRLFTGHQTSPAASPKDIATTLGPQAKKNVYYKDLPPELTDEMLRRYGGRDRAAPARGQAHCRAFSVRAVDGVSPAKSGAHRRVSAQAEGYQLAVEFLNPTWFEGKHAAATLDFERHRGLVNVVIDAPADLPNTIPSVWEVTHPDLAIVRLHGRNQVPGT